MHTICHLAAMDGMSNAAFRSICFEYGAEGATTEMIQALALARAKRRNSVKLGALLMRRPEEMRVSAQIIGNDPAVMAEAARRVEALGRFDAIEINMGCPARCVVGSGNGSALLQNPRLAEEILFAVCASVRLPVILKMRLGWDDNHITAPRIALSAQEAGCAGIILHGRTRSDMYKGDVRAEEMRNVRRAIKIPLFANGAVQSPRDAARFAHDIGADGVCIGRAALKAPWIFDDIRCLGDGRDIPVRDAEERIDVLLRFAKRLCEVKPERFAIPEMRKFCGWYLDGLSGNHAVFELLLQAETFGDFRRVLCDYQDKLIRQSDILPHAELLSAQTLDTVER